MRYEDLKPGMYGIIYDQRTWREIVASWAEKLGRRAAPPRDRYVGGKVTARSKLGNTVTIKLDNGRTATLPPKRVICLVG